MHKKGGAPKTPVYEEKGPKNPGVAAPLVAACCRGNCQFVLLEWWLFPYSFLSLYFVAAEEREHKVRSIGLEPQGCPWS